MNNCIIINGQKIELTEEQIAQIVAAQNAGSIKLGDVPEGETVKIGNHEMIVLEHVGAATLLIRRDLLPEAISFGENNNYDGSNADTLCNGFANEIADIVGEENLLPHNVDLTSDDGLKDYGVIERFASAFTAERQRRYVETLDKYPVDRWGLLATPHSTAKHGDNRRVKCVSPSGFILDGGYYDFDYGVRPYCILKSSIFVSK